MRIRYVGSGVRRIDDVEWNASNDHTVDVPAALAAELLTYPRPEFEAARDEPLRTVAGAEALAGLALGGIGSLAELAALDDDGVTRLASESGLGERKIQSWVEKARELLHEEV